MIIINSLFILSIILLTFMACVTDLRGMKIPNMIPSFIMGLFISYIAFSTIFVGVELSHFYGCFLVGFGIFLLTFIFFALNVFGAGDAKLATALAFWIGLKGVGAYLFFMALAGGVLGLIAIIVMKKGVPEKWQKGWLKILSEGRSDVPYAVAIFCGLVAGFTQTEIFYF